MLFAPLLHRSNLLEVQLGLYSAGNPATKAVRIPRHKPARFRGFHGASLPCGKDLLTDYIRRSVHRANMNPRQVFPDEPQRK